jgi:hypothetical protein
MKLPIQAQPVSRKVSSAMLAKKATNAVGASSACDAACGWAAAACTASFITTGGLGLLPCLVAIGAANCYDCVVEILTPTNWGGGGGGGGRPNPYVH